MYFTTAGSNPKNVAPCFSKVVDHSFDDVTSNKDEGGFHIYTGAEQASLRVMDMEGNIVTFTNYNNQILLLVQKVFSTDTSDTSAIVCYK